MDQAQPEQHRGDPTNNAVSGWILSAWGWVHPQQALPLHAGQRCGAGAACDGAPMRHLGDVCAVACLSIEGPACMAMHKAQTAKIALQTPQYWRNLFLLGVKPAKAHEGQPETMARASYRGCPLGPYRDKRTVDVQKRSCGPLRVQLLCASTCPSMLSVLSLVTCNMQLSMAHAWQPLQLLHRTHYITTKRYAGRLTQSCPSLCPHAAEEPNNSARYLMWSINQDWDDTWRDHTRAPRNHNGLIKQPDSLRLPFRHISCIVNRVPAKPRDITADFHHAERIYKQGMMYHAYCKRACLCCKGIAKCRSELIYISLTIAPSTYTVISLLAAWSG